MGYREITIKLPVGYEEDHLQKRIQQELNVSDFSYQMEQKSLDARKKSDIHWLVRVAVFSDQLDGQDRIPVPVLDIPFRKRNQKIVVVGSGPAGFFSAFVLQKAGFPVTLIERGSDVGKRSAGIRTLEHTGSFDPTGNYAFGEGGAGTFSDGKLTSRTKNISREKQFIIENYIRAGAPEEIRYMAHPHLGSNNLKKIVKNLRNDLIHIGGTVLFETFCRDLKIRDHRIVSVITDSESIDTDYCILATGQNAYETYRMLIGHGVAFRTKNFALGCRVEHPQELINLAQWGQKELPGVKAAEYRLTANTPGSLPVYTFCMCPGGMIVPAMPYEDVNIVNGMSLYLRNKKFANAACVAGVSMERLLGREAAPMQALEWLNNLEHRFYEYAKGYQAPFCRIQDFIDQKETAQTVESSYPLGLKPAALWELLPADISHSIREGLKVFSRRIKGFETGVIMGLESKTSAPIQVIRDERHLCAGFANLFMVGEGSGHSGGIISSGVDGIKAAMRIIELSN
ncbi:MAG: FAD-dependent oxidoreductase [Desulfobacteraceae bacterium]|nr:MAG: FAD-dependent oxidoreductase [Desulfobacteraceae bacterium]